jgi:hypothetical protein
LKLFIFEDGFSTGKSPYSIEVMATNTMTQQSIPVLFKSAYTTRDAPDPVQTSQLKRFREFEDRSEFKKQRRES